MVISVFLRARGPPEPETWSHGTVGPRSGGPAALLYYVQAIPATGNGTLPRFHPTDNPVRGLTGAFRRPHKKALKTASALPRIRPLSMSNGRRFVNRPQTLAERHFGQKHLPSLALFRRRVTTLRIKRIQYRHRPAQRRNDHVLALAQDTDHVFPVRSGSGPPARNATYVFQGCLPPSAWCVPPAREIGTQFHMPPSDPDSHGTPLFKRSLE